MCTPSWGCPCGTAGEWVASRGRRPCIYSQAAALHLQPSGDRAFPAKPCHAGAPGSPNPLRLPSLNQGPFAHSSRSVL